MRIGVLALQGAFIEHIHMLSGMGVEAVDIRLPGELEGLDGLIIPGGESTTIGKLAVAYGFIEPLRQFGQHKAIWGTCAGAILLAREIHRSQPLLGLMDIVIARNAFGRQVDSFIALLEVPALALSEGKNPPFPAVFIRAPIIESVSGDARVLADLPDGRIVAARQKKLLATSFHPELTGDDRFHNYFTMMAAGKV
jgi:5'-phosphate synthase pdxT subunit